MVVVLDGVRTGGEATWLRERGVVEAAMESTAQYWRSVWLELESHMSLHLAQAFSNRAPQGKAACRRRRSAQRSPPDRPMLNECRVPRLTHFEIIDDDFAINVSNMLILLSLFHNVSLRVSAAEQRRRLWRRLFGVATRRREDFKPDA
jgi:hypothetical protein